MIGRAREESFVEDLIAAARAGRSGAVLISGDPGIGKTALLAHARAAAGDALLLEAEGSESESRLAFAGLADLLGPVLGHLDELPAPQAEALRGALALGPPRPGDRFSAYAATLGLLAAAAEERPVVCIVDDAHWLDAESIEALLFATRRLGAEGLAILLGARGGASTGLDASSLPRIHLEGLAESDAARLIAETAEVMPSAAVLRDLVAGAGGNPLALIELAGALSADQLAGREPLPDPLPVGRHLERALLRPLEGLPDATRRALLLASADDGSAELLSGALAAGGLTMADLEPAERAGVLLVGPVRVAFSHPLVRAAVYQGAGAPDRRGAHRAYARAAEALGDAVALDRRAWHLALAATGPDEAVAAALEEAAGRAGARTAYAAACEALEAAARLSPDPIQRGRRLIGASQAAVAAGAFSRAGAMLDEVAALAADPAQVMAAMAGRGYVEMFGGSTRRAVDMLAAAAERVQEVAPLVAAGLFVQAVVPCFMRSDLARAVELAERAAAVADGAPPSLAAQVDVASAITSTYIGLPRLPKPGSVAELARQSAAGDPVGFIWSLGHFQCLMLEERYDESVAGLDGVIAAAREHGTPSALPWPLAARAEVRRRTGRLREATADASEGLRLAEDTGQNNLAGYAHAILALVDAVLGKGEECRAHARRAAALGSASDSFSLEWFGMGALALLALGAGDLAEADGHLATLEREYRRSGAFHPLIDGHEADLIETRIRLGRRDEVVSAVDDLARKAELANAVWPAAAAARCRGLLAPDDDFEQCFAEALALHERTTTPFERARTLLCLGERRRRARRPREARDPLAEALDGFEALGAATWAEWARRELRAAGMRTREPRRPTTGALTSQELQVALAVSQGATNKEAASALLISPKTVEYHLARVYAKLGVRTRAELAGRMARESS